ncbi:hypothetical protein PENTCL1PPCAC_27958, partial [Pristionchus entomophagus]
WVRVCRSVCVRPCPSLREVRLDQVVPELQVRRDCRACPADHHDPPLPWLRRDRPCLGVPGVRSGREGREGLAGNRSTWSSGARPC